MLRIVKCLIASVTLAIIATASLAQAQYRIKQGDTLQIEVLEDATLNRAVVVLPDGRITFPFAGAVRVAGRTVAQVETSIASAIASQFQNPPSVFVSVRPLIEPEDLRPEPEPETINVYFVGEVNEPGLRPVEPGTTFLQAIAQSGGLTRFAATKRLQLRRSDAAGRSTVVTINYKALSDGAALEQDVVLRDGDVILVPERRLFE